MALKHVEQEHTGKPIVINASNICVIMAKLQKSVVPIVASITATRRCLVIMSSGHSETVVAERNAPRTSSASTAPAVKAPTNESAFDYCNGWFPKTFSALKVIMVAVVENKSKVKS